MSLQPNDNHNMCLPRQAPFCHSSRIVREETTQNRDVEVDSIISAVSSLFIQDLQRSINLLLS